MRRGDPLSVAVPDIGVLIMPGLKSALLGLLQIPGATAPFAMMMGQRATIFMLHRFRLDGMDIEGHDPVVVKNDLEYLRRNRYDILDLEDLLRRLAGQGPPLRRAVAFTIDDGYADQAQAADGVFAAYDCPVTTFVTSGFLDGRLWFWWDRIEHVIETARRMDVRVELAEQSVVYDLSTDASKRAAQRDFTEQCKRVPDAAKHEAIRSLAAAAETELPDAPPSKYAPMSWDQLRRAETFGMRFGPHTVTHPILSRIDGAQARVELETSWARVRAEARRPMPVFCYPNGGFEDFGPREIDILESMGLAGAVVGVPGYADARVFTRGPRGRFTVPRFSYPDDRSMFIQYASGVERAKQILRREDAA